MVVTIGLPRRLAAMAYDTLLVVALLFLAMTVLVLLNRGEPVWQVGSDYSGWVRLYLAGVAFLYYGWCWTHGGQTVGMRVWRCYVVSDSGRGITWGQALGRFLLAGVSLAAGGLGFIWSLWQSERLTWHDLGTRTRLVHLSTHPPHQPDPEPEEE